MSAEQVTPLENRLLREMARHKGAPLGHVALHYGVRFDEATGTLYRHAQDTEN